MTSRPIDQQLINAIDAASVADVQKAIATGANVNLRDEDEIPVLHTVALRGEPEILKALIAAGADVDARDATGHTALILLSCCASTDQQFDVMQQLIEAGADVNANTAAGNTALHGAAVFLNSRAGKLLLENGVESNATWRHAVKRLGERESRQR